MDYIIRKLKQEEVKLLDTFLYEAIFIPEGVEAPPKDIIDGLGGLTKGAIYYHFRSKEEILIAVVECMSKENSAMMKEIRDDPSLTGKEKIEKMFAKSLTDPKQKELFTVTPNLVV